MKRYTFLLLAFFLATGLYGALSANRADIKSTSSRNTIEVGSVIEPVISGSRTPDDQLINDGNGNKASATTKIVETSSDSLTCRTYEGQTYDQGDPGYSDCVRNIRTDRQGTRRVP